MRPRAPFALAAALVALASSASTHPPSEAWTTTARWAAEQTPKRGTPRSIGGYGAGCLQGAEALPPEGPGFEVLHLSRHRYFGHPMLLGYVRELALAARSRHLPTLLIGDLAQARGGPTPSDHDSHQSGLDVDVSYVRPASARAQPISRADRDSMAFPAVFDLESRAMTPLWSPQAADLLELAASDTAVDRIFVNSAVKEEMCKQRSGAAWLAKLRPWWGHHDHFHVRLKCPAGSPSCRAQPPVPDGDGCDDSLRWWSSEDALAALRKRDQERHRREHYLLPAECRAVLR